MTWDFAVRMTDIAIIVATFFGPIFAVRTQRKLDEEKALRTAKEKVFNMLMATRATWLAPGRVEALNSIPIVFYGQDRGLVAINQAWRDLLHLFEHANSPQWQGEAKAWEAERLKLDTALLRAIGSYLGFEFPELDIKTLHYFPVGLGDRISDEEAIRRGLAAILAGKSPLPVMNVVPDPIFNELAALRASLAKVLDGAQPLSVRLEEDGVSDAAVPKPAPDSR
ncbi:DUF6680 family protein [Paraburkholderia caledonica]|uniref:DUF6680 domain-containing protein n=1 Tax=Paraburkholderia caledonica TaxID=134536 RepID=A0ABU1KSJ9_9BURK|nr:DUF6680 family protein [Paraburkholderia caledonica]MDR6373914.1 hypothetical protein [Paraburkholderia caledonica]